MSTSAPIALVRLARNARLTSRSPKSSHPPITRTSTNTSGRIAFQRKIPTRFGGLADAGGGVNAVVSGAEPTVDIVELRGGEGVVDFTAHEPGAERQPVLDDENAAGDEDRKEEHQPTHDTS